MKNGIIFLGHGSHDPKWANTFTLIARRWGQQHPKTPATIAFLDYCKPAFSKAVEKLRNQGVTHIAVVPVFIAGGFHLADIYREAAAIKDLKVSVGEPIGEHLIFQRAVVEIGRRLVKNIANEQKKSARAGSLATLTSKLAKR